MMAGTHVLAGTAAWSVLVWFDGGVPRVDALVAAALGSLLPDIDHPSSWVGRRVKVLSVPISKVFGHRGITHSLLAVMGCLFGMVVMGKGAVAPPLLIGYLSHLVCDSFTKGGVPLLWPWRRPFGPRLLRTGGTGESVVSMMMVVGDTLPWISHLYPALYPDAHLRLFH